MKSSNILPKLCAWFHVPLPWNHIHTGLLSYLFTAVLTTSKKIVSQVILLVVVYLFSHVWLFWPHELWPTKFLCSWDFPGKNTGVDPWLVHVNVWQKLLQCCGVVSLQLKKKKRILEWVAISFSSGSSRPWDQTCAFCIGRWILYGWTKKILLLSYID